MIHTNSGGHDNLALVRLSQISLQNRHQLIWARRFGCCYGNELHSEAFGPFAFAFCFVAYTHAFFRIFESDDKFVLVFREFDPRLGFPIYPAKAVLEVWQMPTTQRSVPRQGETAST